MGPRFFKRGECGTAPISVRRCDASMGPRFFKRGECPLGFCGQCAGFRFNGATLLQAWRAGHPLGLQTRHDVASMGPRFFKRGEHFRPAQPGSLAVALQWGHASSSVESPRPRYRGHTVACFNGATLLQAWRAARAPRRPPPPRSFNGATLLQAWRVSRSSPRRPGGHCFNGATLLQAWRAVVFIPVEFR